jgi:hypothetical protein
MLDKNLQRNKEKLAAMQAEYAERQRQCEIERAAVPSIAEFFGRLFRLHRSSVMRIGLTDGAPSVYCYYCYYLFKIMRLKKAIWCMQSTRTRSDTR